MQIKKPVSAKKWSRLDDFLYTKSVFAFICFFGFALWAFWSTYYGKLHDDMVWPMRLHGLAMTSWCLMLILQALLIRLKKNKIHKITGKLSYLIVPAILITGIILSHQTVNEIEEGSVYYYYFIALMFNALIAFAVLFSLAIWYRKSPLTHARFMVCTIFPLFTPITDRIIHKYFPQVMPLLPELQGMPMVQVVGFVLSDFLLLLLLLWDWKANNRKNVFPIALLILVVYHLSVLTFYKLNFWQHIGDWIMRLPLS